MLTDTQLRALKPAEKIYKIADQRGLYGEPAAAADTEVLGVRRSSQAC